MSLTVHYKIEGIFKLEAGIFKRLLRTPAEKIEIERLLNLDEDEMTLAQHKELRRLESDIKTCVYNKCRITTDKSKEDTANLIYYPLTEKVVLKLHNTTLNFTLSNDRKFFECSNIYFDDISGCDIDNVSLVANAFHCDIKIIVEGDETGECDEVGVIMWELQEKIDV